MAGCQKRRQRLVHSLTHGRKPRRLVHRQHFRKHCATVAVRAEVSVDAGAVVRLEDEPGPVEAAVVQQNVRVLGGVTVAVAQKVYREPEH